MSSKLTAKESVLVEENHNLIYWYIHKRNLNVDDYYDLLANYVRVHKKYDPARGQFSTYFKLRCDNVTRKLYEKSIKT